MKSRPRQARHWRQNPSSSSSSSALSRTSDQTSGDDLSGPADFLESNNTSFSDKIENRRVSFYSDSSTFIQKNPRYSSLWLQKCLLPKRLEPSTLNVADRNGLNPNCYPYPNMADSVDRVFVHALNTVKRIPRTGSARPPESDRLKLYGLYKQATEGDVQGLLPRPSPSPSPYSSNQTPSAALSSSAISQQTREHTAEREKYDAWASHHGLTKTEAKRRYIACLIETMHRYATTTPEARELVGELEFVWDQIKEGSSPGSGASGERVVRRRRRGEDDEDEDGSSVGNMRRMERGSGLRVLRPMSDEGVDDAEDQDGGVEEEFQDARERDGNDTQAGGIAANIPGSGVRPNVDLDVRTRKWRRRMEVALVKLSVEIAALREQIESRSLALGSSGGGRMEVLRWLRWWTSFLIRHAVLDGVLLLLMVAWARWRGDRRLEEGLWGIWYWIREQVGRVKMPIVLRSGIKLF